MGTLVFRDFDAFADSVGDVDARMTLCNAKYRSWSISHVALSGIHVQLGRLGSGNIVEGESWSDGYLFYLPLTDGCAYSANGTTIGDGEFMVLEPGCDFCIATQAEHDWCSIFVPTQLFARGIGPSDPPSASARMVCRIARANHQVAGRFRAIIEQVLAVPTICPKFESSPAASCAESDLLDIAVAVVAQKQAGQPCLRRAPETVSTGNHRSVSAILGGPPDGSGSTEEDSTCSRSVGTNASYSIQRVFRRRPYSLSPVETTQSSSACIAGRGC
jgi:hypothetical protein